MAVGTRYVTPNAFDVDPTGTPYTGGKLYFYQTGTSTPLDTYSDVNLTFPNPNPVVADAGGHFGNIFLSNATAYNVIFTDQNDVQVWQADPVGPASGGLAASSAGIIGEVRMFAGLASAIPPNWYLCFGQAVSRTTYADAFNAMGTSWGAGDGSTTFNLPDGRGRVPAGLDNMGGVAANRLTAGVCGVPGTTLGGSGGDQHAQEDTITASATNTVTDPGHDHDIALTIDGHTAPGGAIAPGASLKTYTTNPSETGITVATSVTATSSLTGTAQNVQPTAMFNFMIYLGA